MKYRAISHGVARTSGVIDEVRISAWGIASQLRRRSESVQSSGVEVRASPDWRIGRAYRNLALERADSLDSMT
jgi:hypothetical protein